MSLVLVGTDMSKEEVSVSEFAKLQSDVNHLVDDISEVKDNQNKTSEAIQSINLTLVRMTDIAERNQELRDDIKPRLEAVEKKQTNLIIKVTGIAGFASGVWFAFGDKVMGLLG